jgi:hypothetical protein
MKMFLVVYENYLDESTTDTFREAGFKAYTKIHDVTGEGEKHRPRLGNRNKGPGRNNTLSFAVADQEIPQLVEVVQRLKERFPTAGFRAFTFPLEQCI